MTPLLLALALGAAPAQAGYGDVNSLGLPLNPPGSLTPQTPFDQTVRSGPWASS